MSKAFDWADEAAEHYIRDVAALARDIGAAFENMNREAASAGAAFESMAVSMRSAYVARPPSSPPDAEAWTAWMDSVAPPSSDRPVDQPKIVDTRP